MGEIIGKQEALEAFGCTVSRYQELTSSSGDLRATDYGQGAESGKTTCTGNSQKIQATSSDFICDVELSAGWVLSSAQLAYFKMYYKSAKVIVLSMQQLDECLIDACLESHVQTFSESRWEAVRSFDSKMREALGRRLIWAGISPPSKYMEGKDLRSPRRPKQRWSHLYGN